MLDQDNPTSPTDDLTSGSAPEITQESGQDLGVGKPVKKSAPRKRAAKKATAAAPSGSDQPVDDEDPADAPAAKAPAKKATAKKPATKKPATKKAATKKPAAKKSSAERTESTATADEAPAETPARARAAKKKTTKAADATPVSAAEAAPATEADSAADTATDTTEAPRASAISVLFQPPVATTTTTTRRRASTRRSGPPTVAEPDPADVEPDDELEPDDTTLDSAETSETDDNGESGPRRRPRRRGGRRRRKPADGEEGTDETGEDTDSVSGSDNGSDTGGSEGEDGVDSESDDSAGEGGPRRRRRRRRAPSDDAGDGNGRARNLEDEITAVTGSTRLEAKKQRRREGREAGRRRAPIVSEAEFLARREAVDRVMVIRQREDLTQIAVLEDKVLVEHYVARESQTSLIGNVYLGRVQNVLPSMEAAFIDIGKGRNAVLYAGEVNWQALGHPDGQQRKIESVLQSGQHVLVQVTKDPVAHKGARLTSQISLPGRFLVYVPDGTTSGISRKLPDTERNRLKNLLKDIVPDTAGVIVRTAAEGASEDELTRDVERLTARWADIEQKVAAGRAPELLYGEPDLTLKVVRDLFTEDFSSLVIQGDDAWDLVDGYVSHVAPDLRERLSRFEPQEGQSGDIFAAYRVDEQIAKGLDRKVWLPSGGSLVIDRTEAMTVVDVNTGKFTGSGGNLEETVTKNNLEAAEEIVRQLRLRDIGGIIVIDFIDMVLESNRDLVLRRLVECLGRDRTRHQVAEVTSLGLVQMTRKRIGTGLLEAFSADCDHCKGRGVVVHEQPVEPAPVREEAPARGRRTRGRPAATTPRTTPPVPSPRDLAGSSPRPEPVEGEDADATASIEAAASAEPGAADVEAQDAVESTDGLNSQTPADSEPTGPAAADGSEAESAAEVEAVVVEPAPVVKTSTRRRGARRPAGPPATPVDQPAGDPANEQSPESAEVATVGLVSLVTALAAEEDAADDTLGDEGADEDSTDADTAIGEDGTDTVAANLVHVPIKRKGSRKR